MDFEKIKSELAAGNTKTIEEAIEKFQLDWRDFEKFVAEIFRDHSFHTKQNFRFKTKSRYEIDVLAVGSRQVFCVDCKEWSKGRNKKSGLLAAIEKQEKRLSELKKFFRSNLIARRMLGVDVKKQKMLPLVVTWMQEDIVKENKTIVVPVWKLNDFLLEVENYC
jgi:hypothetical protein